MLTTGRPRVHGGTLIVVVPLMDGVIICADRRVAAGTLPDLQKVEAVGQLLFAVAGVAKIDRDDQVLFDVQAFTRTYLTALAGATFDSQTFAGRLGTWLHDNLTRIPFENWPHASGGHLIDVLVAWVTSSGPSLAISSVDYRRELPLRLGMRVEVLGPAQMAQNGVIVGGAPEVWQEIRAGNDPRFDDLRADDTLRDFAPGSMQAARKADVMTFARRLFAVTSERWPWLKDGRPSVAGSALDAALLTTAGVEWLSIASEPR
jgi:hypothetical protein